jgi:hypothetical protein
MEVPSGRLRLHLWDDPAYKAQRIAERKPLMQTDAYKAKHRANTLRLNQDP